MKTTMKFLLIGGMLTYANIIFSAAERSTDGLSSRIMQSYREIKAAEQTKRKLRYGAGMLSIVGIGGLIYYSWITEAAQQQVEQQAKQAWQNILSGRSVTRKQRGIISKILYKGSLEREATLKNKLAKLQPPAQVLTRFAAAKRYIASTIKNSFFGLGTFGTAAFMTAMQAVGMGIFTKGVLNPLIEKIVATYALERFIGAKTNLNQNIRNVILSLAAIDTGDSTANELHQKTFNSSFALLEKDIVKVLGFMTYIYSLIKDIDPLKEAQGRNALAQVQRCLKDLYQLKKKNLNLKEYKAVIRRLVYQCESFAELCPEAGTDFMEDLYASVFKELKKAVDVDEFEKIEAEKRNLELKRYESENLKTENERLKQQEQYLAKTEQFKNFQQFLTIMSNPQGIADLLGGEMGDMNFEGH